MRVGRISNKRLFGCASALVLILAAAYLVHAVVSVGNPRPATPIRLISGDWAPFVGPDLTENGPVARIVTETFQRMGYEPEVSYTSWDLILDQTHRVTVLGAFPFVSSASRRENYDFSDPILEFDYVLFYYRPNVPDPDDLSEAEDFHNGGYTFGKVSGYDVWPALAAANFEFQEYPTSLAAFQALAAGDIDFLPEGRLVGEVITNGPDIIADADHFAYLVQPDNPPENELLGVSEALYLLLPKSDSARRLLDQFNQELEQVRQTTVYSDALAEINRAGSHSTTVALQPPPGETLIPLIDSEGHDYLAPLGSMALVLEWPAAFEQPVVASNKEQPMVTVKLLNGPLQGRVVQVDARAVRLVP